jgi:hypothetical protein
LTGFNKASGLTEDFRVSVRKNLLLIFSSLVLCLIFSGCATLQGEEGEDGVGGPEGLPGDQGPQGESAADSMPCAACVHDMHIADLSVDGRVLGKCSVGTSEIAAGAVKDAQIAPAAVTNIKLNNTETPPPVQSAKLANQTVTDAQLATDSVVAGNISAGAVLPGNIAENAVNTEDILIGAINRVWHRQGNNYDTIGVSSGCTGWRPIDDMTMVVNTGKTGAYLMLFNATIDPDNLDPVFDDSAWVRLVLDDGSTVKELSRQSVNSGDAQGGINFHIFSLHAVQHLDAKSYILRAEWKVCGAASLESMWVSWAQRNLVVVEFAKTEVFNKFP